MSISTTKLAEVVDKANNIIIVGHYNPDGDAVGATMALMYYLENMGKTAQVIYPNRYPLNLTWMDSLGKALFYAENKTLCNSKISSSDLIFCLDFQSLSRTEEMYNSLHEVKAVKVLIDHHIDPMKEEFDFCFSETGVSSTCEKLYQVISAELNEKYIDKRVASCLYAGLCTDTGSFSYSCGHSGLFTTVAELIKKGADTVLIHRAIFDTFTASRMRLLGHCLGEKLVLMEKYNTAYMYLNTEELETYKYQAGDLEGVVNYALSIENVIFAAFFTQRQNRIRISFRSKGDVDTNIFARKYFNGGGHKNASGGSSFDPMPQTLNFFESLVPEMYEEQIKHQLKANTITLL